MPPSLGPRLRTLRRERGMSQAALAARLGISPSYLNMIEAGKRALSAEILVAAASELDVDLRELGGERVERLAQALVEVFADPVLAEVSLTAAEVHELAAREPILAGALVRVHQALREGRETQGALATQVVEGEVLSRLPSEEVTEFIERHRNHHAGLEAAAESFVREAALDPRDLFPGLVRWVEARGVRVRIETPPARGVHARYDRERRELHISEWLPTRSRNFELARMAGRLVVSDTVASLADDPSLSTPTARALGRTALLSYFSAAVLMPYASFHEACESLRYDVELVGRRFRVGFEQACHRMTTLSRPGLEGVPFHLVRIDVAGNISKRFSGSGIHFARFSGVCPRWNVFSAFAMAGRIRTQVSRMPDGQDYLCIARTVQEDSQGWGQEGRLHAVGLGTNVAHARRLVYGDGVALADVHNIIPIGVTCRLCERADCEQRAVPSVGAPLNVDDAERRSSPYGSR
ncbi:MAG: short-chain fatty acyl-CoA regulator family protein [Pseudomonadota bacterium]|nr:short-chain fatty acyl-CoA regulator family protein [Pseudomonadota bacterium]